MAEESVVNFFHTNADNVGDRMCGPAQYLWPNYSNQKLKSAPGQVASSVVIGGGQIFSDLKPTLERIRTNNPEAAVVGWGIGLPLQGQRDKLVLEIVRQFSAFGTRNYDWKDTLDFVPCASCLSPLFDAAQPPTHEAVAYLHRKKPSPEKIPKEIPVQTNALRDPADAINFIASGDTVITSSYHGVYWAQLLGRRVVCVPYNEKFATFQHTPTMSSPEDWMDSLRVASRSEAKLDEYRAINRSFAQKVAEIWNARTN